MNADPEPIPDRRDDRAVPAAAPLHLRPSPDPAALTHRRNVALRTTFIYVIFAATWIGVSDTVLSWVVRDPGLIARISLIKGGVFVLVTGVLLFYTLRRQLRQLQREIRRRDETTHTLVTQEAQLSNALRMANAGHWEYDVATNRFTFNDLFYHMLRTNAAAEGGYSMPPERYAQRFLTPEAAGILRDEISKAIQTADPALTRVIEHDAIFADGAPGRLAVRAFVLKDASGRTLKTYGVTQDVTHRKETEAALRQSRALYQSLVEQMPAGVCRRDAAGRFVYVNPWFCQMVGVNAADVTGLTDTELGAWLARNSSGGISGSCPTMFQRTEEDHATLMGGGGRIESEEEWTLPDGARCWMQISKTPVYDDVGRIVGSQGVIFDITARKLAEAALSKSEERLQMASHVGQVGTFERDFRTGRVHVSPLLQEQDGYDASAQPWENIAARVLPEDRPDFDRAFQAATDPKGDGRLELDHRMRHVDSTVHWHRVQAQTWFEGTGPSRQAVRMIGTVRDITQQRQTEEQLRTDELRYRSLFENMLNGVARCRMLFEQDRPVDFVYLEVNRAFETLTGLKEVTGRCVSELIPGIAQTDTALLEFYGRVVRTGLPESIELHVSALKQWYAVTAYRPAPGEFVAVFDIITQRKDTEHYLFLLSRTIEQSPVSIMITDARGAIEYVNPKFCELSGYGSEELIGQNPRVLKSGRNPAEVYQQLWAAVAAGKEWRGELHNRRKDGQLFWERVHIAPVLDENGRVAHLVAMKEDISEHRQLEDQLRRAQRVEALGGLASGIAHDLNNILAPVLLAPSLLRPELHGAGEPELALIEQSARRGADLVKQLLLFSRGTTGDRVPLAMNRLIQEMRSIVTETFPREITLRLDVSPKLLPVLGDSTQLHQVLLNLCVNARDAMPAGGVLTIAAENVEVGAEQAKLHPPAKPGPHVVVQVTDNGVGIAPEVMEHIFDPFFTTKPEGHGTGLGLSTVLGIMRGHGGFITVSSTVGKGSTFSVYVPVVAQAAAATKARGAPPPQARGELILIVDDERLIRASSAQVLRQNGYRVVTATDGASGLAAVQSHQGEIALVLTDVMMPVMNGVELVRTLRQWQPNLPIVIITGMASDSKVQELKALGVTEFIAKPCAARELLETVHHTLIGPIPGSDV